MPSIMEAVTGAVSSEGSRVRPVMSRRRGVSRPNAVFRRADGSEVEVPANELGYVMMMEILRREWWSDDENVTIAGGNTGSLKA